MGFLNLPAGAQIMAIDDEPVGSIAEAVGKMAARINAKADQGSVFQFVVSIAAKSGNKRVYVFSDESGAITQQTIPQN